jgi:hypothetical protein
VPHPIVVIGAVALGAYVLGELLGQKKRIFVSYYYEDDRRYKHLLTAWSANKKFKLEFEDVSADVDIQTTHEGTLKRVLTRKIKKADALVVLVGKKSHRRKWVRWEIEKAKELGKKIIAVKIEQNFQSPTSLLSSGVIWATSFDFEGIKQAMDA